MGSKKEFIEMVNWLIDEATTTIAGQEKFDSFVGGKEYWNNFSSVTKTKITEKGKKVLDTLDNENFLSAKDIGIKAGMIPRSVSGTLNKLVVDGYVEKKEIEKVMHYRLTN